MVVSINLITGWNFESCALVLDKKLLDVSGSTGTELPNHHDDGFTTDVFSEVFYRLSFLVSVFEDFLYVL